MDRSVLLAEWLTRFHRAFAGGDHPVEVVGMKHLSPPLRRRQPLLARDPQEVEDPRADVDHGVAVVDAVDVQDGRQPIDDAAVASFEIPVALHQVGRVWRPAMPISAKNPPWAVRASTFAGSLSSTVTGLPASR